MSLDYGAVSNVIVSTLGDELAADVAAGAMSLTVVDAADFSEDGGTLTIGTETINYTAVDDETGIVTLAAALASAYVAGVRVLRSPLAQEKWAWVMVGDDVEAVVARVPFALWDRLPEGVRSGEGELVSLGYRDDEFTVADVLGTPPAVTASYGAASGTVVGGAGVAQFGHGLGVIPAAVVATFRVRDTARQLRRVPASDTTTLFALEFRDFADAVVANGTFVTVEFAAFA